MKRGAKKFFAVTLFLISIGTPLAFGVFLPTVGHGVFGAYNITGGTPAYLTNLWTDAPIRRPQSTPASNAMQEDAFSAELAQQALPANLPTQHRLKVENVLQLPELPNGCEAAALTTMLRYFSYDTGKMEIAYNYIPGLPFEESETGRIGGDPELAYPGNPADGSGYYCLPRVVVRAANDYLLHSDSPYIARDITGATQQEIMALVADGLPVMAWITRDDDMPHYAPELSWVVIGTDVEYTPYKNLHVAVVTGYDEEYFYLCDPLERHDKMPIADFMTLYQAMEQRAVVISR